MSCNILRNFRHWLAIRDGRRLEAKAMGFLRISNFNQSTTVKVDGETMMPEIFGDMAVVELPADTLHNVEILSGNSRRTSRVSVAAGKSRIIYCPSSSRSYSTTNATSVRRQNGSDTSSSRSSKSRLSHSSVKTNSGVVKKTPPHDVITAPRTGDILSIACCDDELLVHQRDTLKWGSKCHLHLLNLDGEVLQRADEKTYPRYFGADNTICISKENIYVAQFSWNKSKRIECFDKLTCRCVRNIPASSQSESDRIYT